VPEQHVQRARAWWLFTALLMLLAVAGGLFSPGRLDWQPALWSAQPWRWWTAAAVHHSALHLLANLLGAAALGWLAWSARADTAMTLAWALAWPLTHLGLALRPDLLHYGGLSGVLHAGVAVIGVHLLRQRRSAWGAALLIGLAVKLLLEQPWGPATQRASGWDIAVAPWGHLSGAVAGLACAALVWATTRTAQSPTPATTDPHTP
jgi:rhomboid family GlyGly-CTERM serine protease